MAVPVLKTPSSPLLKLGVREEQNGFVVDRVVLENVIRIRRTSFPIQSGYVAFFSVMLLVMLFFFRPDPTTSLYFLAVLIDASALGVSSYEMIKTLRRLA
jgi:hypothetical protein